MMNTLLNDLAAGSALPLPVVVMRLLGALGLCGLIGFERELHAKAAGLRTHILTGVAACVYCIVMLELVVMMEDAGDHVRADPIRVVEAVTEGVAFLAAGLIVLTRGEVRGLTTGAGMWLSAAIGVACGLGLWSLAVTSTILALVVMRILKEGEKAFGRDDDGVDAQE
ncbi:MgtC/SapB family protein [Roseivivax isoporae]|uniref:Protein MgtC n=1 Tax=Roseivivax isoporae LMG 25204 TaxID=1449351 RepID=X7FAS2_9RHOB|nr:MgtC/SapB family protein [Roseivivax isoporae]ETX29206.1 membrane protein [Roseivivax isoporae LMG 25204]